MSGKKLPYFREWFERNLGIDINHRARSCVRSELNPPQPINNQEFIDFLYSMNISYSNAPQHRIVRSHGHTGSFDTSIYLSLIIPLIAFH